MVPASGALINEKLFVHPFRYERHNVEVQPQMIQFTPPVLVQNPIPIRGVSSRK